MAHNEDLTQLTELYASWTTEDLVQATTLKRGDYRPQALRLMEDELRKRGARQRQKQ